MNNTSRAKNSMKNASSEIAMRLMTAAAKFVMRTVFIYTLGKQYNGVSGLFTDILMMFSLAELGINRAIAYALYKPLATDDADAIARIMKFYKTVYRIIAGAIFVAGLIMLPFLKYLVRDVPDIKESISLIFMLFVVQSATSYLFVYKATLFEANQQKRVVSYVNIIFTVLQVICESALLIIFRQYLVYLVFSIATNILKNAVVSIIADRKFPVLQKKGVGPLTKQESKQIKADIGAMAIYNVSNVTVHSSDSIIAAAFFPTSIVGILSNYRLITNTLNTLISQISASAVPSIGNLAVTATADKLHRLHDRLSFIMFVLGNFVSTALIVMLNPFVGDIWIGKEYLFDTPTVIAIVFNLYLCIMQYPNTAYRNSNGLFVQGRIRPLIMAIINIVLSITLAYYWGIFGILVATPISRLVTETWYDPHIVYKHVFKKPMTKYIFTRIMYFIIALLCCGGTYLLSQYLVGILAPLNVYIAFLIRFLCSIIVPNIVVLLIFCKTAIFRESTEMLLSSFKKKKK